WMGQEFHATGPFRDSVRMGWREASAQHRIFRAHRDLIDLRELLPALQNSDLKASTGFINDELDLMAYWRLGATNEDNLVVLFNFSNQDRTIGCPFPTTGLWHVQFNSDWGVYGSDFGNVGPTNNSVTADFVEGGSSVRANVPVAAQSMVVLARSAAPAARLADDLDADGLADGWETLTGATSPTGDADNDGISNLREYQLGFDPNEVDPTTVTGQFNEWNPASAAMKTTSTPSLLHYLYVTETAAPAQEMKFLFAGAYYGTSASASVASIDGPGDNIPYSAPGQGYAYFTFNTATKAYSVVTFTPTSRLDGDADGMDDRWETWHGVSSASLDPDGDGFTNVQEFQRGSSPNAWNRPAMSMAGLNGNWAANANLLVYFWHNSWRLDLPFRSGTTSQFKFTSTAGATTTWWGDIQPDGVADDNASAQQNININFNQGTGIYRFQFNEASSAYQVTYDATDVNADGIQDAWVTYYGLSGSNALATADPDGDGWSNFSEMNRGTSPLVSNPKRMSIVGEGALPVASWNPAANNMTWSDVRNQWEWLATASSSGNAVFKFAQGPQWSDPNWGTNTLGVLAAGASNITRLVISNTRYRVAFNDVALSYSISNYPISTEWWETNNLPTNGSWSDDTDGDGNSQLMEYALGGNPNLPQTNRLISSWATNQGGSNRLVLRWTQRTNAVVNPEWQTGLVSSNWTNLTPS
ncbi:MAG: DUF3459 domain-containing protein, partial [Verrucomicrobiota bacterium]